MKDDPRLERLVKLLRLADPSRNSDEGEANNSFRAACRYMRTEGLSFDDLFGLEEPEVIVVHARQLEDYSDRELVDTINECPGLSDWEREFAKSVRTQSRLGRRLSAKQRGKTIDIVRALVGSR